MVKVRAQVRSKTGHTWCVLVGAAPSTRAPVRAVVRRKFAPLGLVLIEGADALERYANESTQPGTQGFRTFGTRILGRRQHAGRLSTYSNGGLQISAFP